MTDISLYVNAFAILREQSHAIGESCSILDYVSILRQQETDLAQKDYTAIRKLCLGEILGSQSERLTTSNTL